MVLVRSTALRARFFRIFIDFDALWNPKIIEQVIISQSFMINLKSEYEISSPIAKEDLAECLFDAIDVQKVQEADL